MFGYVRPSSERLAQEDKDLFQHVYCGLCHSLKRRYGLVGRFILNYDLTFMAMLLSNAGELCTQCGKCFVHPIRKRTYVHEDAALDVSADYSVILTWWQIQDGIKDSRFLKSLKYRVLSVVLKSAYKKAKERSPLFDQTTATQIERLDELEHKQDVVPDEVADSFALLMASIADGIEDETKRRVLRQIFYHLGRWIYLVDATDDLKKDFSTGSFNPWIPRFSLTSSELPSECKKEIGNTLDQSVRMMATAFELGDFGVYRNLIENIFYEGLYVVGTAVLNGTFHQKPKPERKG